MKLFPILSPFSILTTFRLFVSTSSVIEVNETGLVEYQVPSSPPPPPTPSSQCSDAKTACENDTDCYHRLFYSHTTCVTGACKPQCKTAILRLYETKHGRLLLHSDFTCLGIILNSVVNCQLDPRSPILHCTLAKLMCELDDACSRQFDEVESNCEKKLDLLDCAPECAKSLSALFNQSIGRNLVNCTCWNDDDVLCHRMKETTIDSCKNEALRLLETNRMQVIPVTVLPKSADQSEMTTDFRNSNVVPVTKKPKEETILKNSNSASLYRGAWGLLLIFIMLSQFLGYF